MYYYQYTLEDNIIYFNNNCNNSCLICLDNESSDINKIVSIQEYINYKKKVKECLCNSFFHEACLDLWFNIKNSCPICRRELNIIQLTHSNSYQWEESFIIEENSVSLPKKVLQFIIFISLVNAFYIIIYILFSNTK
jgi:hypothetical protein